MNIRQLEVFITVVESKQVTKAANLLHVAQPSVSQTIAEIERQYDVKLFERLNKKLFLTPVGKDLYAKAKMALSYFGSVTDVLINSDRSNKIRIGATVTVGNCMLGDILKSFGANRVLNININSTKVIEEELLNSQVDLALVEGHIHNGNLIVKELCCDEMFFVASNNYEPNGNRYANFITREAGSGTRELTEEYLLNHDLIVENWWESSSTEAIKSLLKKTTCCTAISSRIVKDMLDRGEIKRLENMSISRQFYLVYHKDKVLTDDAIEFIECSKQCMQNICDETR